MSIYDALKDAGKLAKEANRMDLHEELLEVREEMAKIREENLKLTDENKILKERLEIRGKIEFDREKGLYWIKSDSLSHADADTPIWPRCYDENGTVYRLKIEKYPNREDRFVECHNCKAVIDIDRRVSPPKGRIHR